MKKQLLSVVFLLLGLALKSQITVNHEALPQPGDTFAMRYSYNSTINIGTPNASSQYFDFTSLGNDSLKFATYGITSQLPFAAEYPQSNLYTWGPSILYGGPGTPVPGVAWGWMLFRTDVEGMSVVGYRTGDAPNMLTATQTPPLMLMKTPFTYDNSFQQNSQWSVFMDKNPADVDTIYTSFVNSNLLCDAWGTLSTPIDQNLDVIRIREYRISVDSIYGKIGSMVVWKTEFKRDTVLNYQFYSPSKRHPVVTVFCYPDETPYGAEYLWYSDLHNSVADFNKSTIRIFPNPANNFINLEGIQPQTSFEIYDLTGKIITKGNLENSQKIDIQSIKQGVYFLMVESRNSREISKFIKQ